jgi:hypothetical protein
MAVRICVARSGEPPETLGLRRARGRFRSRLLPPDRASHITKRLPSKRWAITRRYAITRRRVITRRQAVTRCWAITRRWAFAVVRCFRDESPVVFDRPVDRVTVLTQNAGRVAIPAGGMVGLLKFFVIPVATKFGRSDR